ncbi:MAG: SsrA-binding protein SmpB [Gammaproteobacteria bacterium]
MPPKDSINVTRSTRQDPPKTTPAKASEGPRVIAENRRARFDYFIEERYEAGLVLEGWEVKALRAGKAQITEAYVFLRNGEVFLTGAHLSPLKTTSTHVVADPTRTRKLLLNKREIEHLVGAVERKGFTIVPLELYWQRGKAKLRIGLAKGKQAHDKRATEKDRDWARDKARLLRRG